MISEFLLHVADCESLPDPEGISSSISGRETEGQGKSHKYCRCHKCDRMVFINCHGACMRIVVVTAVASETHSQSEHDLISPSVRYPVCQEAEG